MKRNDEVLEKMFLNFIQFYGVFFLLHVLPSSRSTDLPPLDVGTNMTQRGSWSADMLRLELGIILFCLDAGQ